MSVWSLLTLCLTASGSYVKCACHKNTFHINLLGPLVETLALMNHDLSKNESTQNSSIWKNWTQSLLAGCSVWHWKKLLVLTKWTIVYCSGCAVESVCCWQLTTWSDDLSDSLNLQHRAERRVHEWPGHNWTQDNFHQNELQGRYQTYRECIKLYLKVFQLYNCYLSSYLSAHITI